MVILDINNRTENWKTVTHFYGLSKEAKTRLAKQLLADHYEKAPSQIDLESDNIRLELFWKGMRDYVYGKGVPKDTWVSKCAETYNRLFHDLRESAGDSKYGFPKLKDNNYNVSKAEYQSKLFDNLRNTEIDIVLETPNYLFIGEAKDESSLKGESKHVLVHQLIREYVMASVLVELAESQGSSIEVVPFIVGTKLASIRNSSQVRLMLDRGWMRDKNLLGWKDISKLARGS